MSYMLVINPGSTSTKIAVYDNLKEILNQTIRHNSAEIEKFETVNDQYEFRVNTIEAILESENITIDKFDVIVGRGGLLKPVEGGAWIINDLMLADLKKAERGEHASNLGAPIAQNIADKIGVKAYIVDPVVVDEFDEVARISGIPEIERTSIFHALNQKATARGLAKKLGKKYKEINAIVAHMGGGVSVGAHYKGKVIDVTNGVYGEGSFSPERSGAVPDEQLVHMCFCGRYSEKEIIKKIHGKGGMVAYLGTADGKVIHDEAIHGNKKFQLIRAAMAYQLAKDIGSMATVLNGDVDGIVLTGGLAFDKDLMKMIIDRVKFIADIHMFPGENEMEALRDGVLMALEGRMPIHVYK